MPRRDGIDAKFYRARELLKEFADEGNAYLNSGAYVVEDIGEPEADGHQWGTLRIMHEPPIRLSALAGDVVHNARAALDHLAVELVEKAGGAPSTHTYFPIADDEAKWRKKAPRDLHGADPLDLASVEALTPWGGGDDDFHRLHRLDITDKHRGLLTALGHGLMEITTPLTGHTLYLRSADPFLHDGERIQVPLPPDQAHGWATRHVVDLVLGPSTPVPGMSLREFAELVERVQQKVEPIVASLP